MHPYAAFQSQERKVAYFSMEVGLRPEIPTYSGGLGVLAGDTLKSFADLGVSAVGVTLLYAKGFFHQEIDGEGSQVETSVEWNPSDFMTLLPDKATISIEGRTVLVQAWLYPIEGVGGYRVPLLCLDTNIENNAPEDREITAFLYGGDDRYRFKQELVLGIGGMRILRLMDHENLEAYHMNEGHAALLTLELMDRYRNDLEQVRELCVFTTHTPVPAGHDTFPVRMVGEILGEFFDPEPFRRDGIVEDGDRLNMTRLALHHAEFINGVAQKHAETSRKMFPDYRIDAITNGIHSRTWTSEAMAALLDRHIPGWRKDSYALRNALDIPREEIAEAHRAAKRALFDFVEEQHGVVLDPEILTIGFARRFATYKRADLLLRDIERLRAIAADAGPLQILYAGKAHPADRAGKELIREIHRIGRSLEGSVPLVYLSNYDMYRAGLLVAGVDVWLNTPLRPMEASGTSGMKAALNGVINFSVLDGWWIEGFIEGVTGWSIGRRYPESGEDPESMDAADAENLYEKLETQVLPCFYGDRSRWANMMAYNIALNGSFFNTHRMVAQYVLQAYFR